MKSLEIRKKFIDYFHKNGHTIIPSSSLVPYNDPTLLFTNAGMNQFKDYFTGKTKAPYKRAVSVQKCVRAGGKHNDLENVGFTARHHTFFEMLGNFSFGDYFKKDAIIFAWEFLTEVLKIDPKKLYVTVHHSDDEAISLWKNSVGFPGEKIFKKDKDNFWEMGEFGPCGPCSEIFYDHGPSFSDPNLVLTPDGDILDDGLRYVEIWNLVFMQYEKSEKGTLNLPAPCIDTGAGLERIASVLQGKYWNYDTDCFSPIISKLSELTHKTPSNMKDVGSLRVVADHIRSASMLISDGVIPSNEGRGYVLRRIIRRAVRHLRELEAKEIMMPLLVPTVFETLGGVYKENEKNISMTQKFLEQEEKKFLETLDQGVKFLEEGISEGIIEKNGQKIFSGFKAFKLYDTFGFPLDLTEVILKERGISLNTEEFNEWMTKQQETSRKTWKGNQQNVDEEKLYEVLKVHGPTKFMGYDQSEVLGTLQKVLYLKSQNEEEKRDDLLALIFNQTPFYPEQGGQVGDTGTIFQIENGVRKSVGVVVDTKKGVDGLIVHYVSVIKDSSSVSDFCEGKNYQLVINTLKRDLIKRNHSATHLLHKTLSTILGPHVKQAGSLVSAEKLRFDFTHFQALTVAEFSKIKDVMNEMIQKNLTIDTEIMNKVEAEKIGAMALFGEKYGDKVRVVKMQDYSLELCGGTHVINSGEIGYFLPLSDSALSNGVRRFEALTSTTAISYIEERSHLLKNLEEELKTDQHEILKTIQNLKLSLKSLEKEKNKLEEKIHHLESVNIFDNPEKISSTLYFKIISVEKSIDLRKYSDLLVENKENRNLVALFYQEDREEKKITLLIRTHKENNHIDASQLLKNALSHFGGKGGGRKDMAQGSGIFGEDLKEKFEAMVVEFKASLQNRSL